MTARSLVLPDNVTAYREGSDPCKGWYFQVGGGAASYSLPPESCITYLTLPPKTKDAMLVYEALDALYQSKHGAGVNAGPLTPRLYTREEREAKLRVSARRERYTSGACHRALSSLVPCELHSDVALVGPGSWTHARVVPMGALAGAAAAAAAKALALSGSSSSSSSSSSSTSSSSSSSSTPAAASFLEVGRAGDVVQMAVARAVQASMGPGAGGLESSSSSSSPSLSFKRQAWSGLLAALTIPNALLLPATISERLASPDLKALLASDPGLRAGVLELLAASQTHFPGATASVLCQVLDTLPPASGASDTLASSSSSSSFPPTLTASAGGSTPSAPLRSGVTVALSRAVSLFIASYSLERGKAALLQGKGVGKEEGGGEEEEGGQGGSGDSRGGGLSTLIDTSIVPFAAWRAALAEAARECAQGSEGYCKDAFLNFCVGRGVELGYGAEFAGNAAVAADLGVSLRIAQDCLSQELMRRLGGGVGGGGPSSLSLSTTITTHSHMPPILAGETSALVATLAAGQLGRELLVEATTAAAAATTSAALTGQSSGGEEGPGWEDVSNAWPRLKMGLAACSVGQEVSLSLCQSSGVLAEALSTTPADPRELHEGDEVGAKLGGSSPPAPENGCFEAGMRLRRLALDFFSGSKRGREDFFPPATTTALLSPRGAVELAVGVPEECNPPPTSSFRPDTGGGGLITSMKEDESGGGGEGGEGGEGEEWGAYGGSSGSSSSSSSSSSSGGVGGVRAHRELESRAQSVGCCRALSKEEVGVVLSTIVYLYNYLINAGSLEELVRARDRSVNEGGEEEEGGRVLDKYIQGCIFTARLFATPDVITLLLHCIFHPTVNLEEFPRPWEEQDPSGGKKAPSTTATQIFVHALTCASLAQTPRHPGLGKRQGVEERLAMDTVLTESSALHTPYVFTQPWTHTLPPPGLLLHRSLAAEGSGSGSGSGSSGSSMVVEADGGGGEEDVEDDEDGLQAQLYLEGLLVEVSQSCKPGGVLQRLLEECEGGGRGAMMSSSTAASSITAGGRGAGGGQVLRDLSNAEASATAYASSHPLIAAGLLHWMRHQLLLPHIGGEARGLGVARVYSRMALSISQAQPATSPSTFALLRQAGALAPRYSDPQVLKAFQMASARELGEFIATTGVGIPVLEWAVGAVGRRGGISTQCAATLVLHTASLLHATANEGDAPSFSLPFALALVRLVFVVQKRLIAAKRGGGVSATAAAAAAYSTASTTAPSAPTPTPDMGGDASSRMTLQVLLLDVKRLRKAPVHAVAGSYVCYGGVSAATVAATLDLAELNERLDDIDKDYELHRVLV